MNFSQLKVKVGNGRKVGKERNRRLNFRRQTDQVQGTDPLIPYTYLD